jgi:ribose transport system ATP-binding protein
MQATSEPSLDPLLRVRGVGKAYPGVRALHDVNLDFFAGEIVAICGANGAGKSTLARLLSGQETPTNGEIHIRDRREPVRSQRDAFNSGILMLHQEPLIVDDFTVGENVWLYALRGGGAKPWSGGRNTNDDETRSALDAVGLRGMATTRLGASLAPGQRQMLALTRAVVNEHRVLILDETTASTTESYFELVKDMVVREKAAGTCVIFVSHRMQEVLGIADRIVVLRNGALVTTLDARATNANEITSLMIGDALRVVHRPPSVRASAAEPMLEVSQLCAGSAREVSFAVRAGEIVVRCACVRDLSLRAAANRN